jgi:hypothetical protein
MTAGAERGRQAMKRLLLALMTVAALSVGIVWAEGQAGKADKAGMDCSGCCCSATSCAK